MTHPTALHRPPSLADAVVSHIRDGIVRGAYAPGQQLSEAQLAVELGTSRGTVREALRELVGLGLVTRSTHKGSVVTLLTPKDAEEIYTLRANLESLAARLAAERGRLNADALSGLSVYVETIVRAGAAADIRGMVYADMAFHSALSALSGHGLLVEHLGAIQAHSLRLLFHSDLYQPDFEVVVQRHNDLLRVLREGDPTAIAKAVAEHITGPGRDIADKMIMRSEGAHGAVGDAQSMNVAGSAPVARAAASTRA